MDRIVNRLICFQITFLAAPLVGCMQTPERTPLRVVAIDPDPGGEHAADAPLRIVFDGYLDPAMDFDRAVVLTSAEVAFEVAVGYDPTGPALVVQPPVSLRPGLGYRLRVDAEVVRGVDGRSLAADHESGFIARPARGRVDTPPIDFEADLAPALAAHCGCHGEEPQAFPPLRPDALINQPARADPERLLVAPGEPLASELVLKVLPDYPHVRGLGMPPEGPPLPAAVVRDLVRWIEEI
jgi:hypothetical protein